MIHMLFKLCLLGGLLANASSVYAAIDVLEFDSDQDRLRYQSLVAELRCPMCQNQNLADSNSQIAIDLRNEVYRLMNEKLNDDEIKTYLVNRYGDFVLYKPPVQNNTIVLWWAPVGMLAIGLVVFVMVIVKRSRAIGAEGTDSTEDVSVESSGKSSEKEQS